jgi:alpha-1,6-mannosyltransferase
LTVAVDSYFWGRGAVWPELSGLYFNVYEGKSAEWGVSDALYSRRIHASLKNLLLDVSIA